MDCKEFREVLDLYVDKELSPDALMAARTHLNECGACHRAERQLARLRRALKLVVSEYDPPDELVGTVQRITRPPWRALLGARKQRKDMGDAAQAVRPFWRESVRLPVPIFLLLVVVVVMFGVLFFRIRLTTAPPPSLVVGSKAGPTNPNDRRSAIEAADFSRFDHGGRVSLYKEPR